MDKIQQDESIFVYHKQKVNYWNSNKPQILPV